MKNIKLKIAGLLLFLFSVNGIYWQSINTDKNSIADGGMTDNAL
ncbi:hypothetical protein [Chryseobacterium sp. ISL-6]|nr:hypothetical protein [Chryseobacterium sp. ISL-6]